MWEHLRWDTTLWWSLLHALNVVVGTGTVKMTDLFVVHRQLSVIATISLETASLIYWRNG